MQYHDELTKMHQSACALWGITEKEDMYKDSLLFLKTFYDFFL